MTPQEAIDAISKLETTDQEFRLQIAPILAAVQPVDGITLTREEAVTAVEVCGAVISEFEGAWPEADIKRFRVLAARLESELS
jgi:hypothetical protein